MYKDTNEKTSAERTKEYKQTWYSKNKEKVLLEKKQYYLQNKDKLIIKRKAYRQTESPQQRAFVSIKSRAFNAGIAFDLDPEDIIIPEYCPILGIKLKTSVGEGRGDNHYSVDRLDPSKGYVKGNIQVISMLANIMKNKATPEQLLLFADWVYNTYGN